MMRNNFMGNMIGTEVFCMKKYAAFLIAAAAIFAGACCSAHAYSDIGEFEDDSVIVVMKPQSSGVSLFSLSSPFDGLGISETKNLDVFSSKVSLFSMGSTSETLKLTLSEPGREKCP
jgi:hypothetical protein